MKRVKKLASLLLAAVMVLSLTITAFAANNNTHTITVKNKKAGHTYTAYQIFKGDISNGKLTNIEWGSNVNGAALLTELKGLTDSLYTACTTAEDVAEVLAGFTDDSNDLDTFAEIAAKHITGTGADSTESRPSGATESTYTISVTGDGYYLVKDKNAVTGDDAATKYILKVVGDVTVEAKADTPTIDKIIKDADLSNGNATAEDVGKTVNFEVTSKVPDMDGYDTYTYIVHDTMTKGLTPVDADNDGKIDIAITIDGTAYTDFTVAMGTKGADGSQSFTITFNNFIAQKAKAGKEIKITYAAVVNENALITDVEKNTVDLEYSNNPYDEDSKGRTPEKTVYVYDFDINVYKYDGADATKKTPLAGAKFVLYKKDAQNNKSYYYWNDKTKKVEWKELTDAQLEEALEADPQTVTEVVTDDKGNASFKGLDTGTYYLHETEAPQGFNVVTTDVEVIITATYKDNGELLTSSASSANQGQYAQTVEVENKEGTTLPSTGGMGTTIFYLAGSILVLVAVVLLVVKRRMRTE